ncbi:hypothetical protein B5V02_22290 [Mesorhizobium kowhaii]|uniref:Uncharacterized protein n=1 Tax=Mesorhizobium kowhaii TaxID=1300272 RepID=A0A2W7BZ80_9HYPH|nr:hypothetical protein B5V02_22290 [Mesorhizobium kowhaii]
MSKLSHRLPLKVFWIDVPIGVGVKVFFDVEVIPDSHIVVPESAGPNELLGGAGDAQTMRFAAIQHCREIVLVGPDLNRIHPIEPEEAAKKVLKRLEVQ